MSGLEPLPLPGFISKYFNITNLASVSLSYKQFSQMKTVFHIAKVINFFGNKVTLWSLKLQTIVGKYNWCNCGCEHSKHLLQPSQYTHKEQNLPEFNLLKALFILADVELIPPQRPLSKETVITLSSHNHNHYK